MSGSSRRAARLVLPLVAAGLFAAGCGATTNDSAAGGNSPATGGSSPAAGGTATGGPVQPTGTAGPPSGLPAPSGVPVPSVPVTPPGSTTPAPGTGMQQVGPADNGKAYTLAVGQSLQVQLPSDRLAAGRWVLVDFPRSAVTPKLNNSGLGRFVFQADAVGTGRITFARFVCNTAAKSPCEGVPLPGPKFAPQPPGGSPATFSVTVQVV